MDPKTKGSIHVFLAGKHMVAQWFVLDIHIRIQMCHLWIDEDFLRESNLRTKGFVIFLFFDIVKMDEISPWYLPWYFPMVFSFIFQGKIIK